MKTGTKVKDNINEAEYTKINLKGKLLLPGFINGHMHLYSTFARGMDIKAEVPPRNFLEILNKVWWRLDKKLNDEDNFLSAQVALLDSLKCGVTTVFDHHASPFALKGSLDILEKAAEEIGIRTCLCYETSDRDGEKIADEGIEENVRYIKKCNKADNPMRKALFGMHASITVSDKTAKKIAEAASNLNTGYHVHVCEDKADLNDSTAKYGRSVVERFNDEGLCNSKSIFAHCVHAYQSDFDIMAKKGNFIAHNSHSNMSNAVGILDIPMALSKGAKVMLGTDGFTPMMQESIKTAMVLQKVSKLDPQYLSYPEMQSVYFKNNFALATEFFGMHYERAFGEIAEGAPADLICVDYFAPTKINDFNFLGHFLFGISTRPVTDVFVAGKYLIKNGEFTMFSEQELAKKAQKASKKFWEKF